MTDSGVRNHTLHGHRAGDVLLMDAVAEPRSEGRHIHLFFGQGTPIDQIALRGDLAIVETRSVGGAPHMICHTPTETGAIELELAGMVVTLDPDTGARDNLADKNTFVAIRNREPVDVVLDWLDYHAKHHDLQGAVIFTRSAAGSDNGFHQGLQAGVAARKIPVNVVVLDADFPLGDPKAPAENHPYCTPGAPGKDRMQVPPADPWHAPPKQGLIYEMVRHRFLADARAVANIDTYDLLIEEPSGNVFDLAVASKTGVIRLAGRHVYPWRKRKKKALGFDDHLCVQFDAQSLKQRWCIAPKSAPDSAVWRVIRIGNADFAPKQMRGFYRFMGLRHHASSVSKLVPKSSLIEHQHLIEMMQTHYNADPVRMPQVASDRVTRGRGRVCIVTTMKNEGPFILEWIAYHRAIGVDDFLVYTNDCTDGTDTLLQELQAKGIVQWRENPFKGTGLKPQHAALQAAEAEEVVKRAKWLVCMDVDEYINVKTGDGTLDALFSAVPDANMIAMTWRLFGNGDVHDFEDGPVIEQFKRCAPELARKPHQAWGFKTLFQNIGLFKKLGVHRPKGLNPQLWEQINWVNGSGRLLPRDTYRNAWRSTAATYGYDLVQLNHYAVRSAESFLVKRDRGRVNHVNRDQGLAYWFRMNNNYAEDTSITRMVPKLRAEMDALLSDPKISELHAASVAQHRAKIDELRETEKFSTFFDEITGARMQALSRLHLHFGANVFLTGPDCVPDDIWQRDPDEEFFFTVERGETRH